MALGSTPSLPISCFILSSHLKITGSAFWRKSFNLSSSIFWNLFRTAVKRRSVSFHCEQVVVRKMMGETAAGVGNLEVSVSFGRFENDLLSWEKWSSFSQNKYLEEIEKCSTPGSVAEKKAYFEAHYKIIAAKKAEIEDQQKQFEATLSQDIKISVTSTNIKNIETDNQELKKLEAGSLVEEKPICESQDCEKLETKSKCKQLELDLAPENGIADIQSSDYQTDDIQLVKEGTDLNDEPGIANVVKMVSDSYTDELLRTANPVGEKQESNFRSDPSETVDGFTEELEHGANYKDFPHLVEAPTEATLNNVEVLKSSTEEMKKLKIHKMTKVPLTTTGRRVSNVKKAPLSVTPKSLHTSSSSSRKIISTSTPAMMAISRSSAVKGSTSYSSDKKLAPRAGTFLSPGFGRDATVTAPQKSISKEKVRDKDTVKRAFKPFQHILDHVTSPGELSDSLQDQVLWNAKETKAKVMHTSHKGKEWLHRTGAISANSVAQKPAPLLANSRTDTVTRKGKEMKVSMNPTTTPAGSYSLGKSKEVKESNVKHQEQSRRFKATPLPAFYRGTVVKKSLNAQGHHSNFHPRHVNE